MNVTFSQKKFMSGKRTVVYQWYILLCKFLEKQVVRNSASIYTNISPVLHIANLGFVNRAIDIHCVLPILDANYYANCEVSSF